MKINKLLCAVSLTDEQKKRIEEKLPDTKIEYSGYLVENEDKLNGVDVIFGNVKPDYLEKCDTLKWVQLASAGTDGYLPLIDRGILLTNATGGYGETISEHILAVLLMLQKKLHIYHDNMYSHTWQRKGSVLAIKGSTCLIIGMGDIGGAFAKRMKMLGAYIIGVRRADMRKPDYCDELYTMDKLDELLPRADSVVMVLPDTPLTHGVMNKGRLALMKETAILINVGRGTAIVQEDLVEALNNDKLWGASIDVAVPEPLPADSPLWTAKNLIITPHSSGGFSLPQNTDDVMDIFLENYERYSGDKRLYNLVDLETGYAERRP